MDARTFTRTAWSGALDLLYPPRCAVCGRPGPDVFCDRCAAAVRAVPGPLCSRCGVPSDHGRCDRCSRSDRYSFAWARGAGLYEGTLRDAVLAMKYGRRRRLAEPLGRLLGDLLLSAPFGERAPDALVPIPLHPGRLADRGFNQSELLARAAGRCAGLAVETRALRRVRSTRPQAELDLAERGGNVVGAFAVAAPDRVEGRALVVIDDVITSGSTVDAAACALLESGASVVYAASVARGL